MKLVAIEIEGFRRFASREKLEIDGPLTAIVGPNEAGKTSLLEAMLRLNDRSAIALADRTRRLNVPDSSIVLTALWLVERDDRAALHDLPGLRDKRIARWLLVRKAADGTVYTRVIDPLKRDKRLRARAAKSVSALARKPPWDVEDFDESDPHHSSYLRAVEHTLTAEDETLESDALVRIASLADAIEQDSGSLATRTANALRAAYEAEIAEHPSDTARHALYRRTPDLVLFDEEERALSSDYDLAVVADDPPPALENLARLAELDLRDLLQRIVEDDSGTVVEMLERANNRLREEFQESWSQEDVAVHFDRADGAVLRLHVSNPGGGYTKLEERSDGLKIFVALLALTAHDPEQIPPIVLIDELERHLHYDAQADVVQVFTRQSAIPQIIYTTHSAGCLPEDLGTGVRLVGPIEGTNHSRIQNRFWTTGEGFSPLLVGMGASALAFVPVRNAAMTEGASDIILLPALFREVTGSRTVGFQVAPASSEAPAARIGGLDAEGVPQVAWIVDGDEGGKKLRSRLRRAGIPEARICTVGGDQSGRVVEDLVRLDVYVRAFNEELRRSGYDKQLPKSALRGANRPKRAETWCRREGVRPPSKTSVAYRLVEVAREGEPLTDSEGARSLRRLHSDLEQIFKMKAAPPEDAIV